MWQHFWQHFLCDSAVVDAICQAIFLRLPAGKESTLLEIGPGEGVLTTPLLDLQTNYRAFEVDTKLQKKLDKIFTNKHQKAHLIWGDVLTLPRQQEQECLSLSTPDNSFKIPYDQLIVVGNLPYYITSPLIQQFFGYAGAEAGVVMIQKEVAEKLVTKAKKKSYLWWLINNFYEVDLLVHVPPTAFAPPPKVWSSVITLQKRIPLLDNEQRAKFRQLLDIVSPYTRKMLRGIWKIEAEKLHAFTLPAELEEKRWEELGRAEVKTILHK
jgi:16S rRNA (adenine1518-N6/adenine1519-N6)-dimethyltransferase